MQLLISVIDSVLPWMGPCHTRLFVDFRVIIFVTSKDLYILTNCIFLYSYYLFYLFYLNIAEARLEVFKTDQQSTCLGKYY